MTVEVGCGWLLTRSEGSYFRLRHRAVRETAQRFQVLLNQAG